MAITLLSFSQSLQKLPDIIVITQFLIHSKAQHTFSNILNII
jgi:hypothetical protein